MRGGRVEGGGKGRGMRRRGERLERMGEGGREKGKGIGELE